MCFLLNLTKGCPGRAGERTRDLFEFLTHLLSHSGSPLSPGFEPGSFVTEADVLTSAPCHQGIFFLYYLPANPDHT
jgi:hypothetical protein